MLADFMDSLMRQLPGLGISLQLTVITSTIGLTLGFFGGMLLRHRSRWVRFPLIGVVEIFRGFPALLMLYIVYFGLPVIGLTLASMTAAIVALSLTLFGYTAEIFRAAIASIPRGQFEAAKAVGLSPATTTRKIVLPHVLRVAIPPLIGIIVIGFQGTSLAISIGVTELTGAAFQFGQVNFTMLHEITVAALLYLVCTSLLIGMEVWAERRANRIAGTAVAGRARRRQAVSALVPPA